MSRALILDLATGLLARFLPALLALAAIPVYIRILGPAAYAAVGFSALVQTLMGLLDLGLSSAVTKEAAKSHGLGDSRRLQEILVTFQTPFLAASISIALIGAFGGLYLLEVIFGTNVTKTGIDHTTAVLLFAACGMRLPFSCYSGFLTGVGKISHANLVSSICEAARSIGGLAVLVIVSADLTVYFAWQLLISLIISGLGYFYAHRALAEGVRRPKFNFSLLKDNRHFAASAVILALSFLAANSLDKVLLPRFVSPAEFGQYVALSQLSSGIFLVLHAVWAPFNPRIQAATARRDDIEIGRMHETVCVLMTTVACVGILITAACGKNVIEVWLGSEQLAPLTLLPLVVGFSAAALAHIPLTFQFSAGTLFPMLPIFVMCIIAVAAGMLSSSQSLNPVSGAFTWSGVYVMLLLAGGASTYLRIKRNLYSAWVRYCIAPFLSSVFAAFAIAECMDRVHAGIGVRLLVSSTSASLVIVALYLQSNLSKTQTKILFGAILGRLDGRGSK